MAKLANLAAAALVLFSGAAMAADKSVGGLPPVRTAPPPETPVPPAPVFPAWDSFVDGLRDMWPRMYAKVPERLRDDPQARQEVARLMLEALAQQTLIALASDGDHPVFLPHIGATLNVAQPNADTIYRAANITPGGTYRLRGKLGSLPIFKMAQFGPTPDETGGGIAALGYNDFSTLKLDADGNFDVVLSPQKPEGHAGAWWPLDPKAKMLMVRQMSLDWARDRDPTLSIERLDIPVERTRTPAAELERRLRDIPRRSYHIAGFLVNHVEELRADGYINKLRVFDVSNGGALVGQFYYEGAYDLKPDEALIIEARVPSQCVYSSMILTNDIYETTDWINNHSSLNKAQSVVDKDGILRVVVSAKDPGVPNWLDTSGYPSGAVQGRWTNCNAQPVPTVHKVAIDKVRAALPKDTPTVTPEQRQHITRDRRAAYLQRPMW